MQRMAWIVRPEMKVGMKRVDYVSIPVDDLEKGKQFYGEMLGLRQQTEIKNRWVEYEVGNLTIALYPKERDEDARGGEIGFEVISVDDACEMLQKNGILFPYGIERFSTPVTRGRLARFLDPFGNKLEIIEISERANESS